MADPSPPTNQSNLPPNPWQGGSEPGLNGDAPAPTAPAAEAPQIADVEMKDEAAPLPIEAMQQDPAAAQPLHAAPLTAPPVPQAQIPQQSNNSVAPPPSASTPQTTTPSGARASPHPTQVPAMPTNPIAHGSPTRVYLNEKVTPHLLEGMKFLAAHEPQKPLKWLAEYLMGKSKELEGE